MYFTSVRSWPMASLTYLVLLPAPVDPGMLVFARETADTRIRIVCQLRRQTGRARVYSCRFKTD